MISAAASVLAEVFFPILASILEVCVYILVASVRPWHYLLSPSYRTEVNARYAVKHPFFKWLNLLWGSFLLLLSIAAVIGLIGFFSSRSPEAERPSGIRHNATEKVEQVVTDIFKRHREPK